MAAKKPRDVREVPSYVLDATGQHVLREPPTMTEILTKGSPREVREFLGGQGALIRAGAPLPAPVAEWLGAALEAIGRGADANRALRVAAARRGPPGSEVRDLAVIVRQVTDLIRQGVLHEDALGIVERYRMAQRHSDDPDALHGWEKDEHEQAARRLRERLRRSRQGTK